MEETSRDHQTSCSSRVSQAGSPGLCPVRLLISPVFPISQSVMFFPVAPSQVAVLEAAEQIHNDQK